YLLDAECNGLETALTAMLSVDQDVMAPYREQLKEYLLGPDNPPSTVRFAEAANTLYRSGIRDFPVEHPDQPGFPEQQPRQPA
ncbi:hypothetical protein G3M58_91485, partial [Streptomyces sp. SID7499]|nr:hypothetical protein [Streptomyces sp. SID7499]